MATEKTDPEKTEAPEPDAEETFWSKFDEKLKAGVSGVVDEKLQAIRQNASASRNGGRKTLPSIIADFVFGPDKTDAK